MKHNLIGALLRQSWVFLVVIAAVFTAVKFSEPTMHVVAVFGVYDWLGRILRVFREHSERVAEEAAD